MSKLGIITSLLFIFAVGCSSDGQKKSASMPPGSATGSGSETSPSKEGVFSVEQVNDEYGYSAKNTFSNAKKSKKIECNLYEDKRLIEVVSGEFQGCVTQYTKFGETFEKARAVNEVEVCQNVLDKIASNLSSAGFTCQ